MRHKVAGKLFGRNANRRKALLRGLVTALFEHERIETTLAKAKEARRVAEKIVTMGKRGDLHSKRLAFSAVPNRAAVAKLFSDIAPRFMDRNGGYLRIVRTRRRVNDRAQMAVLEFVDFEERRAASEKKKKKSSKKEAEKKETPKKEAVKKETAKKAAPRKKAEKKETAKKAAPRKEAVKKTSETRKTAKKKDK